MKITLKFLWAINGTDIFGYPIQDITSCGKRDLIVSFMSTNLL